MRSSHHAQTHDGDVISLMTTAPKDVVALLSEAFSDGRRGGAWTTFQKLLPTIAFGYVQCERLSRAPRR